MLEDGKLYSCGSNDYSQLGHTRPRTRPGSFLSLSYNLSEVKIHVHFYEFTECVEGLEAHSIVHVACGSHHTLAQNEWGEIFAWGANSNGQLGLNVQSQTIQFPKMIKYLATKQVVQIACGANHSLALTNG